jgi:hypothetical protein
VQTSHAGAGFKIGAAGAPGVITFGYSHAIRSSINISPHPAADS